MKEHDLASTVRTEIERVEAIVVEAARKLPAATLHEAGGKIGALPAAITPVAPGFRICGTAITGFCRNKDGGASKSDMQCLFG